MGELLNQFYVITYSESCPQSNADTPRNTPHLRVDRLVENLTKLGANKVPSRLIAQINTAQIRKGIFHSGSTSCLLQELQIFTVSSKKKMKTILSDFSADPDSDEDAQD